MAAPSATATPGPATTRAPVPVPVPTAEGPLPGELSGIIGRTLPWASGLRLPAAGTRPVWFAPASGRSEAIGGLPEARPGYGFIRVGGGWVVQANSAASVRCGDCASPPVPVWFLADSAVGDPARHGYPGRAGRRPRRRVADQPPVRCQPDRRGSGP